jgi:hypothetical protein
MKWLTSFRTTDIRCILSILKFLVSTHVKDTAYIQGVASDSLILCHFLHQTISATCKYYSTFCLLTSTCFNDLSLSVFICYVLLVVCQISKYIQSRLLSLSRDLFYQHVLISPFVMMKLMHLFPNHLSPGSVSRFVSTKFMHFGCHTHEIDMLPVCESVCVII